MLEVLAREEKESARRELATVAVVGLGYVGLPVAVAFGRERPTIGYDLSKKRVENLRHHVDATGEVATAQLLEAKALSLTGYPGELSRADFIVVAVPTPINAARQPDLSPLEAASETVGRYMKPGATVVYESTVYPGATEEVCVPILERASGMRWKQDFHVGYSPERINPGDRGHGFESILKVVSGDDAETLEKVAALYASVVKAGVYRASSIRVAEAAKVIENTQRDLNIAFVNELAIIFEKMGLDSAEVLKAAGTKCDIRNSKVIDIIRELHEFGVETHVHDPAAGVEDALHEYGVRLVGWESLPAADALILAVAHRPYLELPTAALVEKVVRCGCVVDVKSVLDAAALRKEGLRVWRL
jgi:UDP-N-acetyl-D-mannosaminuronate dehydrogenase